MADRSGRPLIAVTGPRRGAHAPRTLVQLALWLQGARAIQLSPACAQTSHPYHGVVITGGHDVDPVLYAQESKVLPRYDRERDAFELAVIDDALARKLPLLGICRGAQLLNVRLGGDLHQDLRGMRRTSGRRTILPLKQLHIEPDSRLFQWLGAHQARVNSLHNQAIDRLGAGLRVSARDGDGIVQAIENPHESYLLGVQWHPEFLLHSRCQRRLFEALVQAAQNVHRAFTSHQPKNSTPTAPR